jgi:SAM-dependent methyltransferase
VNSLRPTSRRSCGAPGLEHILDLGHTPLANAFLTEEQLGEPEPTYALVLVFCPSCALVQITETIPPEELFGEYLYFSSFSNTTLRHARKLANRLVRSRELDGEGLVVEAASNDGYLLQYYKSANIPVLGIEPAANVARVAEEERGIPTLREFFAEDLARRLADQGQLADVLHANNVLAHVPDLNGFVRGISTLLKDDGIAVIEVPYVKEMIDQREFDTIYHEHLCYFSLTALDNLFGRHGLSIEDVERIPAHGGSLRVFVGKGSVRRSPAKEMIHEEKDWGVGRPDFYKRLETEIERLRDDVVGLLQRLKRQGKSVAAYGASAKGSTLLNRFGIGRETLDFVVDRSTAKQGRYTPGACLAIHPPEKLLEEMPDYVLLLTWNFAEEILEQQAEYRRRGGRFIIPIPEAKVV